MNNAIRPAREPPDEADVSPPPKRILDAILRSPGVDVDDSG